LAFSPARFRLPPGGSQEVRVVVTVPDGDEDGERHTRFAVRVEFPPEAPDSVDPVAVDVSFRVVTWWSKLRPYLWLMILLVVLAVLASLLVLHRRPKVYGVLTYVDLEAAGTTREPDAVLVRRPAEPGFHAVARGESIRLNRYREAAIRWLPSARFPLRRFRIAGSERPSARAGRGPVIVVLGGPPGTAGAVVELRAVRTWPGRRPPMPATGPRPPRGRAMVVANRGATACSVRTKDGGEIVRLVPGREHGLQHGQLLVLGWVPAGGGRDAPGGAESVKGFVFRFDVAL
jgi:hypothetical protein